MIPYRGNQNREGEEVYRIDPRLLEKGYTNLSRAAISGHANFVNWKAVCRMNSNPKQEPFGRYWTVQLGDGTKRIYGKSIKVEKELQKRLGLPGKHAFLLTEEIKANGNRLFFSYKTIHGKEKLSHVIAKSRVGDATLSELVLCRKSFCPWGCVKAPRLNTSPMGQY